MTENIAPQMTREAWLLSAVEVFRPRFVEVGMPLPERIHVSVGFGFGTKAESANILGQCWARRASEDGVNHLFISPEVADTAKVLACLLHELIHAADDCVNGHKGAFAEAATRFGFTGSLLTLNPSIELAAEMMALAASLGDYPHGALSAASRMRTRTPELVPAGGDAPKGKISSGPGTQTTRMLKLVCPGGESCCGGYTVRTTAKWVAVGMPSCPLGTEMVQA
ncbi:SprT-like domain-containing protein [Micromonospora coerulea]|uniref:SprT-like domain-containing protein n=1 Tax=Micromonospora coerulea TaxID=47856 RepID=UPI0019086C0B|nr:SprT-like domain-containing protein [Micromonospora veneta]